jgi:hypothetical protein
MLTYFTCLPIHSRILPLTFLMSRGEKAFMGAVDKGQPQADRLSSLLPDSIHVASA